MSARMRAKVVCWNVVDNGGYSENVTFTAVPKNGAYPEDGSDEDNTYAKFSPAATFQITIANPALLGKYKPGEKYYVDFTPAE